MLFSQLKKSFYLLFPFTSFLVVPFIQGTTPAFLLCFLFLLFLPLFIRFHKSWGFYKVVFWLVCTLLLLVIFSQVGIVFSHVQSVGTLPLVSNESPGELFLRSSIFTQFFYFLASVIAFSLVVNFFEKKDINFIFWGIRLLILYGMVEWLIFLLTGNQVDFISNRTFDNGNASGSLFQVMTIGGLNLERMKSLTGEPSMFAFTVLPFWVLAIEFKRKTDVFLTTIALVLSLSTTAVFGFFIYGVYKLFKSSNKTRLLILLGVAALVLLLFIFFGEMIQLVWEQLFVDKLSAESVSGQDRFGNYYSGIEYWKNSNIWIKLFGIGFGVIRSTDFFTTVLVNGGVFGLIFWFLLFFAPFLLITDKTKLEVVRKLFPCVLVIFMTLFLSVPEYMYLSIWIPLGIVYNLLRQNPGIQNVSSLQNAH